MNQNVYIGKPGMRNRGGSEVIHIRGRIVGFKGKVVKPVSPPSPYDPN